MKVQNILMVTMALDIGGAETHLLELSLALKKMGYQITVASNGGVYVKILEEAGIKHYTVPLNNKNPLNMLKSYLSLNRIIEQEGIQAVHAHARIPAFISGYVCRRKKIPLVTSVHGTYTVNGLLKHITNWGEKTIAVSQDIRDYLIKNYHISPKNITLSINGIDTARFIHRPPNPDLMAEFGLREGEKRLLYLGRLNTDSGEYAFRLLDIAPALKDRVPGLRIIVVGDGPLFPDLKKKADALNARFPGLVVLTGGRTDVPNLLSLADAVVALSRAALEAMACEKPVVLAGNFGYMGLFRPDQLEDGIANNFTARGFSKPDNREYADDCVRALTLPETERAELTRFSRQVVIDHYSLTRMAQDAASVYELLRSPLPKKKYDFALLGYYGFNNSGDDALLFSIVDNLRRHDKRVSLCVMSNRAQESYLEFGADAYYRFNPFSLLSALRRSRALIFGGGNLIQDATSTKSLLYYTAVLRLAQMLGLKTMLYSNGIGPVDHPANRKLVRSVLNRTDVITLRESNSLSFLTECGVDKPRIVLTADETLTMPIAPPEAVDPMLIHLGLDLSKPILCVSARIWKNNPPGMAADMAHALDALSGKYGCQVLLLPMQPPYDTLICAQIKEVMRRPCYLLTEPLDPPSFIGVIARSTALIGMRLHSLIYSVCAGVPSAGIVYDPKVSAFLDSAGEDNYIKIEDFSGEKVIKMGERMFDHYEDNRKRVEEARARLRELAGQNSACAMQLLEDSLCEY